MHSNVLSIHKFMTNTMIAWLIFRCYALYLYVILTTFFETS